MSVKLLTEYHFEFLILKGGCTDLSDSALANCHIVGNHMSWLNYVVPTKDYFCLLTLGPEQMCSIDILFAYQILLLTNATIFMCCTVIHNIQATPFSMIYLLHLYVHCIWTKITCITTSLTLKPTILVPVSRALAWLVGRLLRM